MHAAHQNWATLHDLALSILVRISEDLLCELIARSLPSVKLQIACNWRFQIRTFHVWRLLPAGCEAISCRMLATSRCPELPIPATAHSVSDLSHRLLPATARCGAKCWRCRSLAIALIGIGEIVTGLGIRHHQPIRRHRHNLTRQCHQLPGSTDRAGARCRCTYGDPSCWWWICEFHLLCWLPSLSLSRPGLSR
jgi:hypothetical protein